MLSFGIFAKMAQRGGTCDESDTQRNDDKQVVLVAYKHLGALETQQDKLAVVDEIFADNAYTLLDAVDGDALIEWGRSNVFTGNRRAEFKAKVYHAVKYRKVEAVELSWVYRKCSYKSKALVDGNGIIYDNKPRSLWTAML